MEFILVMSIAAIVVTAIAVGVSLAVYVFLRGSLFYSRLAISLMTAFVLNNSKTPALIHGSSIGNFLLLTAIVLGVLMLLSYLCRLGGAIRFFCTFVMSFFAIELLSGLAFSIINFSTGREIGFSTFFEIIVKAVCLYFAFLSVKGQIEDGRYIVLSNLILVNLERLAASFIYAVTLLLVVMSLNSNWELSSLWQGVTLVAGTAAAFLADIFLLGKE